MSEIVVRTFDLGMLDDCVDLYMKTYSQEPWNETWDSRDVVASFYKNHYANNYFLGFAAVRDGEIVGVSVGFLKPYINGMEYYVDDFFVSADYHRQGIGSKFMAAIKDELTSRNIHAMMLNTERDFPARRFYESVGFAAGKGLAVLFATF